MIRFTETVAKAGPSGNDSAASPGLPAGARHERSDEGADRVGQRHDRYFVNPGTWPAGTGFDVEWREDGVYQVTTTGPFTRYIPAARRHGRHRHA